MSVKAQFDKVFMSQPTILLIDDDNVILEMYERKLKLNRFKVLKANNGKDGLELAKKEHPDLIITDLVMPGNDGFELLQRIKGDKKTQDIPVITLTNLSNESDRKEVLKLGAKDYIIKSNFTPAQIVEKVKEFI